MHKFFRMAAMGTAACAMLAAMAPVTASAQDKQNVEVLHWWTAGGEAAALDVLKKDLEGKGISWTDMPVAGGSPQRPCRAGDRLGRRPRCWR